MTTVTDTVSPAVVATVQFSRPGNRTGLIVASASAWTDNVVLASAIAIEGGESTPVASFRGSVKRSPAYYATTHWTLRNESGDWINDFRTRKAALEAAAEIAIARWQHDDLHRFIQRRDGRTLSGILCRLTPENGFGHA